MFWFFRKKTENELKIESVIDRIVSILVEEMDKTRKMSCQKPDNFFINLSENTFIEFEIYESDFGPFSFDISMRRRYDSKVKIGRINVLSKDKIYERKLFEDTLLFLHDNFEVFFKAYSESSNFKKMENKVQELENIFKNRQKLIEKEENDKLISYANTIKEKVCLLENIKKEQVLSLIDEVLVNRNILPDREEITEQHLQKIEEVVEKKEIESIEDKKVEVQKFDVFLGTVVNHL